MDRLWRISNTTHGVILALLAKRHAVEITLKNVFINIDNYLDIYCMSLVVFHPTVFMLTLQLIVFLYLISTLFVYF